MRRILLGLLVLVMFTPSLACAKFMDHHKPHPAQMAKGMHCCPKQSTTPDEATMLFKDCMKIDLQSADSPVVLKKVDIVKQSFPLAQTPALNDGFPSAKTHVARGPPFERLLGFSATHLPVFLATQRLRI